MTDPRDNPDPLDPHYFSKLLMRSHPTIDSPLGDLIAGRIDQAEYRRRINAKRAREGRPPASWDLDPLSVFPIADDERVPRHEPYSGWVSVRRRPRWPLVVLVAIVAAIVIALIATPRNGPASQPTQSGAPLEQTWKGPSAVPMDSGDASPQSGVRMLGGAPPSVPVVSGRTPTVAAHAVVPPSAPLLGVATWCRPTATRCLNWGGDALLGAVPDFDYGDRPYPVRVTRGQRSVVVQVVSFCACGNRPGGPTLIDLSPAAAEWLEPDYVRVGVLRVAVEEVEPPRTADDLRLMLEVRGDELYGEEADAP